MPLATADLRPTTPDAQAGQDILGGSCPIAPMQVCIIWAARQEKAISPLAFKVYFAAHEMACLSAAWIGCAAGPKYDH